MFERFTAGARSVVVNAQEECRALGHSEIGTEHLLLGLLAEGSGIAALVLTDAGVDLDRTVELVRAEKPGGDPVTGDIRFTGDAKQALERSLREALKTGAGHIGTEHILLAVLADRGSAAERVLHVQAPAVDWPARVADALRRFPQPFYEGGRVRGQLARGQNTTPAVASVWVESRRLARGAPVSSAHLLSALAGELNSRAGRALASLGVDSDAVGRALDATPAEGTTDETSEDLLLRTTAIRSTGDRVVVELDDPELARLLGPETRSPSIEVTRALDQLRRELRRAARPPVEGGGASMVE